MKRSWFLPALALFLALPASAQTLRVENMEIKLTPRWAAKGKPAAHEPLRFDWSGRTRHPLQVAISPLAPLSEALDEEFHETTRQRWAARFGNESALGMLTVGQVRWMAYRLSADASTLFHLETQQDGRVYTLEFVAGPGQMAIPAQAMEILRRVHFGPDRVRWIRHKSFALRAPLKEMLQRVRQETAALGNKSWLKKYSMDSTDASISWYFDAIQAAPTGKQPYAFRGRLELLAPEVLENGIPAQLTQEQGEGAIAAALRLRNLCAEPRAFDEALAQLSKGITSKMKKLLDRMGGGCELEQTDSRIRLEARPGESLHKTLVRMEAPYLVPPAGQIHAQVLEMAMVKSPRGKQFGDGLLPHIWLVTVYLPGESKETGERPDAAPPSPGG